MKARLTFVHALRVVAAVLLLLGVMPLALTSAASATESSTGITAKALDDHECNSSEWHFVITQIAKDETAPASIHVTWTNGNEADVPLDKVTGGTAHYATTANLDSEVSSATASIYDGWSGEFNLSHGPCGPGEDTEVSAVTPTVTQATCTADYTLTTPSYTVPTTAHVTYFVGSNKVDAGTVAAVAGTTTTVTAKADDGFVLTGTDSFTLTFTANPACKKPVTPPVPASAVSPVFADSVCLSDVAASSKSASYTIPTTPGVDYYLGEVKLSAGKVNVADGSTVTITTKAQAGYVLESVGTFTHTYPTPVCSAAAVQPPPSTTVTATPAAAADVTASPAAADVTPSGTAVLGVKHGATTPAANVAAGILPHTGAGLPIGRGLTGSALLLLIGSLLVAMARRLPEALER